MMELIDSSIPTFKFLISLINNYNYLKAIILLFLTLPMLVSSLFYKR